MPRIYVCHPQYNNFKNYFVQIWAYIKEYKIFSITFDLGFKNWTSIVILKFEVQALLTFIEVVFYIEEERNKEKVLTMAIIVLTTVLNNHRQHQLHFLSGKKFN